MQSASQQPSSNQRSAPFSRRAAILSLVVALHVLTILIVLRPSPSPLRPSGTELRPITIELLSEAQVESSRAAAASESASDEPLRQSPVRPAPPVASTAQAEEPLPALPDIWSQVIVLTKEEFAAADISKMPARAAARAAESDGPSDAGTGNDDGPAEQLGGGPNGEPLYNAEWYRRPTHAELAYYVPAGAPRTGWGMIACQTVEDYRVEDCREIAQFPPGSGLARAVLQAAWQFRVRPPRIGGRPLIGAWVRIRVDFTENGAR